MLTFIIMYPALLLSITVHECAHALIAFKLGDPTAKYEGRISLNPMAHIDLIGTFILPLVLFILHSPIMFGWAKPVPVNIYNLRNPRRDNLWISLAGPLANLITSFVLLIIFQFILFLFPILKPNPFITNPLLLFLSAGVIINIVLAVFNLIPIKPLDGSGVLMGLLPQSYAYKYQTLPVYIGQIILLLFILSGIFSTLISSVINFFASLPYFKPVILFFFRNM